MKKDISMLPHKYIYGALTAHRYGLPCYIEVDVKNSNFCGDSRHFLIRWITSPRNPNYGKCCFRFNFDTYYFDP